MSFTGSRGSFLGDSHFYGKQVNTKAVFLMVYAWYILKDRHSRVSTSTLVTRLSHLCGVRTTLRQDRFRLQCRSKSLSPSPYGFNPSHSTSTQCTKHNELNTMQAFSFPISSHQSFLTGNSTKPYFVNHFH